MNNSMSMIGDISGTDVSQIQKMQKDNHSSSSSSIIIDNNRNGDEEQQHASSDDDTTKNEQQHSSSSTSSGDDDSSSLMKRNIDWIFLYITSSCRSFLNFHRPEHLRDKPIDYVGCLIIYGPKFLLECCGSAGAIWGTSEIFGLRSISTPEGENTTTINNNNNVWRPIAMTAFIVYCIRLYGHVKHYLEREKDFPPIKLHHRRLHRLPFIQIFGTKFLLQVCGGAGALWGSSEVLQWRTTENIETWRTLCIGSFMIFFLRWMVLVLQYCLCFTSPWWEALQNSKTVTNVLEWIELLIVTFVLDVLGSAGAVWGFAEVVTLRTDATLGVWRPIAMAVGLIFVLRWMLQIYHVLECGQQKQQGTTAPTTLGVTTSSHIKTMAPTDTAEGRQIFDDTNIELAMSTATHDLSLKETTDEL
jgi:hypothetical protein